MGWLRKRFGEPSTYAGLSLVSLLLPQLIPPELAQQAAAQASPWASLLLAILAGLKAERAR